MKEKQEVTKEMSEWENGAVRNHKDTLFRAIFNDKRALLSLYNAMNGTEYRELADVEINTLGNAIYMTMKNDISFIFDFQVFLYEQQSTYNPNMPMRDLFYIARLYEKILKENRLYTSKLVKIPTPKFVVFYNGRKQLPERSILRLSDAYEKRLPDYDLELKVTVLNINIGENEALLQKCEELRGYVVYEEKLSRYQKEMSLELATKRAVDECIREGVLKEFFQRNKAEVEQMSIFEYDYEAHMKVIAEEGREEGMQIAKQIMKLQAQGKKIAEIAKECKIDEKLVKEFIE